jgi:hypothetical protein
MQEGNRKFYWNIGPRPPAKKKAGRKGVGPPKFREETRYRAASPNARVPQ